MNHYATPITSAPLLLIENLTVSFATEMGYLPAIRDITFSMTAGETTCLVGESGCGKSLTAKAILRLTPDNTLLSGRVLLHGTNLLTLREKEMQAVRGKQIAMVFQEPMTSLNPVLRIGEQVVEPMRLHLGLNKSDAHTAAVKLLNEVGIPAPEERYNDYPHQLSGGMRQRIMLAIALSCKPDLLLADEPTTALDTTIQGQILHLLASCSRERNMALLLITHNLSVAAQLSGSIGVMYAGRLVEYAPTQMLFRNPRHPYTRGLLQAAPSVHSRGLHHLPTIPGNVPSLDRIPTGCPFHPRCEYAMKRCADSMPPMQASKDHKIACWQATS